MFEFSTTYEKSKIQKLTSISINLTPIFQSHSQTLNSPNYSLTAQTFIQLILMSNFMKRLAPLFSHKNFTTKLLSVLLSWFTLNCNSFLWTRIIVNKPRFKNIEYFIIFDLVCSFLDCNLHLYFQLFILIVIFFKFSWL